MIKKKSKTNDDKIDSYINVLITLLGELLSIEISIPISGEITKIVILSAVVTLVLTYLFSKLVPIPEPEPINNAIYLLLIGKFPKPDQETVTFFTGNLRAE